LHVLVKNATVCPRWTATCIRKPFLPMTLIQSTRSRPRSHRHVWVQSSSQVDLRWGLRAAARGLLAAIGGTLRATFKQHARDRGRLKLAEMPKRSRLGFYLESLAESRRETARGGRGRGRRRHRSPGQDFFRRACASCCASRSWALACYAPSATTGCDAMRGARLRPTRSLRNKRATTGQV